MKKILVVYGSAGEGHKKAAIAIYEQLRRLCGPDTQITLIDSLDYTNRFFKFAYKMGYIFLVKYVPTLWGFFYYLLDNRLFFLLNQPFRRLTNGLNSRKLVNFLKKENFEICVSTHFLATEVITHLKKRGEIDINLITVVTDYKSHLFWLSKYVDSYIVAAEDTKQDLISRGIEKDKIKVFGIPIDNKFSVEKSKEKIIQKLKAGKHKFTILVMGGGFGVGPIKEIVMQIQPLNIDCQVLVVCGHNKTLFEELSAMKARFTKPTLIYGFCNNMDEIMCLADIMVSKVGGMASSESLVSQLPIIAIAPIPGQEMRNAKFMLDNGVGFRIKRPKEVVAIVSGLTSNESEFLKIKEKIAELAKPKAAEDIARFTLQQL